LAENPKRVAILAMGPSADAYARHCAVNGDRGALFDETWTVNAFGSIFQVDRMFHMDDIRIQKLRADAGNSQIKKLLAWLRSAPGPIYTSHALPKEPNPRLEEVEGLIVNTPDDALSRELAVLKAERALQEEGGYDGLVPLPIQDVLNSTGGPLYFNSTPAYAVAFAMHLGVEAVACFGMDYASTEKHRGERGRACVEYWLGRAVSIGISVLLPRETWLMDANRAEAARAYGYDVTDIHVEQDDNGKAVVTFPTKPILPTAAEVEEAYKHD
jgi:hypothetical protein